MANPLESCLDLVKFNKQDDQEPFLRTLVLPASMIKHLLVAIDESLELVCNMREFEVDVRPEDAYYGSQWHLFLQGSHYEGFWTVGFLFSLTWSLEKHTVPKQGSYGFACRLKHVARIGKWDNRGVRLDLESFRCYIAGLESSVEDVFLSGDATALRSAEARCRREDATGEVPCPSLAFPY